MNKNEKTNLIPKLRFSEFVSTGEWKICTLNKLAMRINTRNQDNSIKRVLTNSAIDGVVDQSDYFDREVANQNNLENYFVIDEGDYVYNPRISATAPVGPISKNKVGKGVMSPLYTVFRFENHNNDFYEQYFRTNLWHCYLRNVSNTGARHDRMSISNDSFMKMPLPYHSEKEQQKIADCLSSLDDLIAAEGKRLEAFKAHKKGLMQKLFPAEGKTLPEWRFPEFRDSEEWEEKPLAKVGEIITGNTPSTADVDNYGGNRMFVSPADMSELKYVVETKTKLTEKGFSATRKIPSNSVMFVCIGSTIGKVAQNKSECATNQQINSVVPFEDHISDFIYYVLDFSSSKISKLAGKQAVPIVNKSLFSSVVVSVPEYNEQQKIADCLSSIDDLIAGQAKKMDALKLHKKGLMQGLFPSIEEVSE